MCSAKFCQNPFIHSSMAQMDKYHMVQLDKYNENKHICTTAKCTSVSFVCNCLILYFQEFLFWQVFELYNYNFDV
jgi:hypothetical protein